LFTLTTILAFIFVLGVLVFVHELGHFLAAKRVGIRVLKFQLGFNPTIASFRRGGTEYGLGALPLGGYVKMAGENPDDVRSGSSDEFLSKTKWQRFQVLIMGPAMNLLLAGGGAKAGHIVGATDDLGATAVDMIHPIKDLHVTLLHLLGLDHERLTYRYNGRDFRLTDVHGNVVKEILA